MATTVNTSNGYWEDGESYKAPNDGTDTTVDTQQTLYWQNGQVFLYPFKNTGSTPPVIKSMPIQIMIVTTTYN